MASAVASMVAGEVLAKAPSIADPHPDSELLALGRELELHIAAAAEAERHADQLYEQYYSFLQTAPDALRYRWSRDKGMPFLGIGRSPDEGEVYSDDQIEQLRETNCGGQGDRPFTSGVTGNEAQARIDEIVRAFDGWKPVREMRRAEIGYAVADAVYAAAVGRLQETEGAIYAARATTLEGLAVQARALLREGAELNGDIESDHLDRASNMVLRTVIQLAG